MPARVSGRFVYLDDGSLGRVLEHLLAAADQLVLTMREADAKST
jgi:hypothetical protein